MRKTKEEIYGALTREQQVRVYRAVCAGRALADPDEAAAAVRCARVFLRRRKSGWRWVMGNVTAILAVLYIATNLLLLLSRETGSVPSWTTVLLSVYLFAHVYMWLTAPGRRERIAQAERLNLQLVEAAGMSVETEKPEV